MKGGEKRPRDLLSLRNRKAGKVTTVGIKSDTLQGARMHRLEGGGNRVARGVPSQL